jgi:hypothetical protein
MKHQWLAYVIVGLLSIGAGVAIAGLPNNVPVDATIIPPTTTEAPEPTVTTTTVLPTTTVPDTTEPETTEPDTTEATDTTEPADSVPVELVERSELAVAAANGANVEGAALAMATQLEELGYVEVRPLNGSDIVELTTVYFADGLDEAALRMAEDLDLLPEFIAPIDEAPSVANLPADTQLVVYIGRDRA